MRGKAFKSFKELGKELNVEEPCTDINYGSLSTEEKMAIFSRRREADIEQEKKNSAIEYERLHPRRMQHQMEHKEQLRNVLKERKIKKLVHFTRIENLESILKNGLLSETNLLKMDIPHLINDLSRCDKKNDCICLSVEYPNTKLLKAYNKIEDYPNWVIIEIDSSIVLEKTCMFAEHNAASAGLSDELSYKANAEAFENMFNERVEVYTHSRGWVNSERGSLLNQYTYLPTSDQAEVLVKGSIPVNFIKKIIFTDENHTYFFAKKLRTLGITTVVNNNPFYYQREYYYYRFGGR